MVIKIGVIVPGSGDSKDNGQPIEQAVDLAIRDASVPDYTLELDFQDEVPTGSTLPDQAKADDYQGPAMADYLFKHLKPRTRTPTAYVIDDGEVYGTGLATSFINEWQKLKGSVLAYKHDSNTNHYPSLAQNMSTNPPDVVFFGGRTDLGAEEFYAQIVQIYCYKPSKLRLTKVYTHQKMQAMPVARERFARRLSM